MTISTTSRGLGEDRYELVKWEWSEEDFEQMGWHDCTIYALQFDKDIYLDIDYIFKWNQPDKADVPYTFWMAPATLVFTKPTYFKLDVEVEFINGIDINDISRIEDEVGNTIWLIDTFENEILIRSEEFKQIIRRPPSLQFEQAIPLDERGEVSFSLISEKDFQPGPEIIKRREQEIQQYALVLQRHNLILEKNQLNKGELGTKQYLIKKKDLEQQILDIDNILKGSRFEYW